MSSSPLPNEFPHIFFEIAMEVVPEINYEDLVYLSQLVKIRHRESVYSPLVDAVRKYHWAKLSGSDAIMIDTVLIAEYDGADDTMFGDAVGKVRHNKALLELISHCKAALDSLAVFLNDILGLGFKGGQRDLRRDSFKQKLASTDATLNAFLHAENQWLQLNSPASSSIIAARDEWLHRGFPDVAFAWPPSEVGVLPIPKSLAASAVGPTKLTHYSTAEFVNYHLSRVGKLLGIVIQLCIAIEAAQLLPTPPRPPSGLIRVSAVKTCLTKTITATKLKVGPFTRKG